MEHSGRRQGLETFTKGEIVLVPFPFSDLSSSKIRPALVVINSHDETIILTQITSSSTFDKYAIFLTNQDIKEGYLNLTSMIRPNRLFTASKTIIKRKIGILKHFKMKEVENTIIEMFKR